MHPQPVRLLEVHEQQGDTVIDEDVAERAEHAIAVVDGNAIVRRSRQRTKPGWPPLYDTSGQPSLSAVAKKNMELASMNVTSPSESSVCTVTSSSRSAMRRLSNRSCIARCPSLYMDHTLRSDCDGRKTSLPISSEVRGASRRRLHVRRSNSWRSAPLSRASA